MHNITLQKAIVNLFSQNSVNIIPNTFTTRFDTSLSTELYTQSNETNKENCGKSLYDIRISNGSILSNAIEHERNRREKLECHLAVLTPSFRSKLKHAFDYTESGAKVLAKNNVRILLGKIISLTNPDKCKVVIDGQYYMYDTLETLANHVQVSVSTIKRYLARLKELGFITVKQLGKEKRNMVNYYTINYEVLFERIGYCLPSKKLILEGVDNPVDKGLISLVDEVKMSSCYIEALTRLNIKEKEKVEKEKAKAAFSTFPTTSLEFKNKFVDKEGRIWGFGKKTQNYNKNGNFLFNNSLTIEDTSEKNKFFIPEMSEENKKIKEKHYPQEHELCSKFRYAIKKGLGEDIYLSWFNETDMKYDKETLHLTIFCNSRFYMDKIKDTYYPALKTHAAKCAIKYLAYGLKDDAKTAEDIKLEENLEFEEGRCIRMRKALLNRIGESNYGIFQFVRFYVVDNKLMINESLNNLIRFEKLQTYQSTLDSIAEKFKLDGAICVLGALKAHKAKYVPRDPDYEKDIEIEESYNF